MPTSALPIAAHIDSPTRRSPLARTNVAVGKKGEEGTPAVRKALADPDEHVVEHMVMDGGVSKTIDQNESVNAQDPNYKGYQSAAEMPDRFVSNEKSADIPPPTRKTVDITKLDSILKPQEKAVGADTSESKAVTQEVAARNSKPDHAAQPEMDFPSRVINNSELELRISRSS